MADPGPTPVSITDLERWQDFGGAWRVFARTHDGVTISMCRCDGGEEVQRVTTHDPVVLDWLGDRTSSES